MAPLFEIAPSCERGQGRLPDLQIILKHFLF